MTKQSPGRIRKTKKTKTPSATAFRRNTIAMVYDFDGTLSPQPMQEYTVLPKLGMDAGEFWRRVDEEKERDQAEGMLVYMRHLLEEAERKRIHIGRDDFTAMAGFIKYFDGVETWFDRINAFVHKSGKGKVKLRHYLISAGLKEILEGSPLHRHFSRIYASEYYYNHHGVATFPKILITDTTKTQYLFRINKGREKQTDSINEHMPEHERPIPFSNILYIGDGDTDVPSMTVTRQNGGNAVAVYKPDSKPSLQICRELLRARRADLIAPADYRHNGILEKRVRLLLTSLIANISCEQERFLCRRENDIPES
ncbi:MAG: HAD family hydrolase [Gammaproteobacteria bacterium]|nr:HAD family hydrolase [Gammaproteobacteria bacterium]